VESVFSQIQGDARRLVTTYLVLVFGLSCLSYFPMIASGTTHAGGDTFVITLMWTPAVSAVLTMLAYRRTIRGMGWGLGRPKYLLIAYALPIVYSAAVYLPTWALIPGSFEPKVPAFASTAPNPGSYLVVMATVGIAQSMVTALGEEIGWRGLLVPQLARMTCSRNVALISGAVWVVWHSPVMLFSDYNSGAPAAYSVACFGVMTVGLSFAFTWLRLRSGSLWAAAILHASHNLFVQAVFDVFTERPGLALYVVGEFGIGLALAGVVVGLVFWRRSVQGQLLPALA
jgi:membrane protease YdiL (CAAX protease family)